MRGPQWSSKYCPTPQIGGLAEALWSSIVTVPAIVDAPPAALVRGDVNRGGTTASTADPCTRGAGAPTGAAGAQRRAIPDSGRRCRATGPERGAPASGGQTRRLDALTYPVRSVTTRSPCLIAAAK